MAVKIRVKANTQSGDPKPKQEESKSKVKIKVKSSDLPDIQKDPTIKGPVGFLNSYYDSPEFAKRYIDRNMQPYDRSTIELARKYNKIEKGQYDIGSHAVNPFVLRSWNRNGILPGSTPTVLVDTADAKRIKSDVESDTVPHEYSHTSRGLNIAEEEDFIKKNKNKKVSIKYPYNQFIKSGEVANNLINGINENMYSNYLATKSVQSHDEQPTENYADLNALRYMMYKQGIYDTRKGPMTIEHLKKAMNDPWLKKQFAFDRLLKTFKPEDIVNLNNTIAYNNNKTDNQNTA